MHTSESSRLDYLDGARAFALLLGIVFHAALSFMPMFIGWAVQDVSTSPLVSIFVMVCHSFRMELFFLLAGFFSVQVLARQGLGNFLRSRTVRILVPFVVGWFVLRPLLASGWTMGAASLRGDYDFWASLRIGVQSLQTLPAGIFTRTHLWFLWYLAVITGLTLLLRGVFVLAGARGEALLRNIDRAFARVCGSWWMLPVLAVPTAVVLWFMRQWGVDTPEGSLVPEIPVLLTYGGFFGFGWMLGRQPELLALVVRLSAARWIVATIAIFTALSFAAIQGNPSHPRFVLAHVGCVAAYAVMMWSLVFLTLGVFHWLYREKTAASVAASPDTRPVSRWRAAMRYIADSSYWLYLAHLPLVVWLDVAFAEFPLPWWIKLPVISLLSIAALLLSYDAFVRSTWIGAVLNGRRRERVIFRRPERSGSVGREKTQETQNTKPTPA